MNQNTKVVLGLVAVAAVAYFLWEKSKKDAASDAAKTQTKSQFSGPVGNVEK